MWRLWLICRYKLRETVPRSAKEGAEVDAELKNGHAERRRLVESSVGREYRDTKLWGRWQRRSDV